LTGRVVGWAMVFIRVLPLDAKIGNVHGTLTESPGSPNRDWRTVRRNSERQMTDTLSTANIPAPFVSSVMRIQPDWIDYNGHLNMAYYHVLFDRGIDEAFLVLGLGAHYVEERDASFFTVEAHVCYLRELALEDPVEVRVRLLDHDEKRAHIIEELVHAEEGWTSATLEQMSLHVDMAAKRASPWPDDIKKRLEDMQAAHADLPVPPQVGRVIRIKHR
jgi:acyl-CoA thioester hydrolase